ncbi:hypothetical protein QBC39DRAFT_404859 [Podospora conica]|nr:hypothetical protein QBC39DRAFT_404859 [Schizothecium conicum]
MDEYPPGSLDPSIPFLLTLGVAGLADHGSELKPQLKEQGFLLRSDLPPLETQRALSFLRYIRAHDASHLPWSGRESVKGVRHRFRIRTAVRTVLLPPRRARLPEDVEQPPHPVVLHSPFSPLSPISPLYPDGVIGTEWILKHHVLVPGILLCFYNLVSDPTQATLQDNQIKTDINNLRGLLSQSGYKTRLAVVLISDEATTLVEGVPERVETIRRGCSLDSKCIFLVPPAESTDQLERIAENMLTTLYGVAIEYYRDLGRHARKKRGRGIAPQPTVPPTSGTSGTLSLAGWNVRYDFKSAVFAEFRVEFENALRSYDQAYEGLLSSELLEVIPSWNPRWNEARFLADVIAVRYIASLLWGSQHSAAVRRWQLHHDRMADFVERLGRGTNNYGWKAWESRWAVVMANLIERAGIPDFAPPLHILFLQPEKAAMGERLQPWELLHHTGYWYRLAAKHLYGRRALAHAMPEDDRRPPGLSPASQVAGKAFAYDTYMCPDPHQEYPLDKNDDGVDHSQLIVELLMKARSEFLKRHQVRFAAELSLECAKELAVIRDWPSIVELLRPLWKDMSYRTEGWLTIVEDLSWMLRRAASMVGEAGVVVAIDWELLNRNFTRRASWPYNIIGSLDGMTPKFRPKIHIEDGQTLSFVSASFIFRDGEGKAGQSVNGQLAIRSNAHPGSSPVPFTAFQIDFNGSINRVVVKHEKVGMTRQERGSVALSTIGLQPVEDGAADGSPVEPDDSRSVTLQGVANLSLAAGQTIVLGMQIPLREPGETCAVALTLVIDSASFELDQYLTFQPGANANNWYLPSLGARRVARTNPLSIKVLPRPPQMEIVGLTWKEQYYTNEPISLEFEIVNEEELEAAAKLDATLSGKEAPAFTLEVPSKATESESDAVQGMGSRVSGVSLGAIESSKSITTKIRLPPVSQPGQHDLVIKVVYFLSSNPGTPITQTATFQLAILNPFEANYDLLPRVHPDPWPSLFDPNGIRDPAAAAADPSTLAPTGLSQTWSLVTRYASFAAEDLRVLDVALRVQGSPTVHCTATRTLPASPAPDGWLVQPKVIEDAAFDLVAQRATLDDRSPTQLNVSLLIRWRRADAAADAGAEPNTTTLPVPRFAIFGIEPRVLASAAPLRVGRQLLVELTVVIENASNHLLTFGVSMEPSDEFAFSGPKQTALNLLPVTRRFLRYRLLPLGREGGWLKPGLAVRDMYFKKVLRVVPTEGMKADKDGGVLVWVPPDEE